MTLPRAQYGFEDAFRQAMEESDRDPAVERVLLTTTLNREQAEQAVAIARNAGIAVQEFVRQCGHVVREIGTTFSKVIETFTHGATRLNDLGNVLLNMKLDRVPHPALRAIVRLGHAERVVIVYDGTTAKRERGRVFVQAHAALWNEDGETDLAVGAVDMLCSLGLRRYVERDEKFWHALGFATVLIRGTADTYVLKTPGVLSSEGARSGRLSSTRPNVQNIPRKA